MGITQHLVRSGIAHLEQIRSPSPSSSSPSTLQNLYIRVDRSKVLSSGRAVAAQLLTSLQVFKSTADGAGAPTLALQHTRTLKMSDEVLSVRGSPDGRLLCVALLDATVKVFYADSLKFFLSLYGHKLPVLSMDVSHDSKLIVTAQ